MLYQRQIKIIISLFLLCATVGCFSKELPLPEHEKGIKRVSGSIKSCDFHELGTWGFTIFLGIKFKAPDTPYIRYNFPRAKRTQYETWCNEHADVSIQYQAKRTALRPEISYWARAIEKKGNKPK